MGSEWTEYSLGDLGRIVTGKTPSKREDGNFGDEVPFVTPRDLDGSRNIEATERYLSEQGANTVKNSIIPPNSIAVSCIGSDMGKAAIVKKRSVTNQQINSIILEGDFDYRYVYYVLSTRKQEIRDAAGGSAQPILNKSHFSQLPIRIPPLPEQKAIAHILGTLDDKIELNRRMNATLEGMAQALFKSWFVDFDPVLDNAILAGNPIPDEFAERAKVRRKILEQNQNDECSVMNDELEDSKTQNSSLKTHHSPQAPALAAGNPIPDELTPRAEVRKNALESNEPSLSAEASAKAGFPAAFEFTEELGWIPEGWETSTIDDECEIVGGGTPSTKNPDFWDGGEFPWVTPKDFSALQDNVLLSSSRFLTQAGLNKVSSGLLPKNTVLMSSRAPVGYLAITKIETAINQGFIGMICNKRLSPEFVLQWADSRMDDIQRAAGGSTFAEISKKAFRPFEIVVPSQAIVAAYTEAAGAFYGRIADGVLASNTLTKLRETLLPELISGELRLPKVEQLCKETIA